jgi:hypothetical protein
LRTLEYLCAEIAKYEKTPDFAVLHPATLPDDSRFERMRMKPNVVYSRFVRPPVRDVGGDAGFRKRKT